MKTNEKVSQVVTSYLTLWAPHLLDDSALRQELCEEAEEAGDGQDAMHDAVHTYFVSWCAVRASELASEGGGGMVRRTRPGEIWANVAATDRFAASEFGELRSSEEKLSTWFEERIDEVISVLRHHNNGRAEGMIDNLDEWLCRGFKEDDPTLARKRRTLVRTVALLRREFGTTDSRPEVPAVPENPILQEMREAAKTQRRETRERTRSILSVLTRRRGN